MNNKLSQHPKKDKTIIADVLVLKRQLTSCYAHIKTSFSKEGQSLDRLFALQFLDTLIYQQLQDEAMVAAKSVVQVLTCLGQEALLHQQNPKMNDIGIQLSMLIKHLAHNDTVKKTWNEAISQADVQTSKQFAKVVVKLMRLDLASLWINTAYTAIKNKNLASVIKQAEENLAKLAEGEALIAEIVAINPEVFEDPKKFDGAWAVLSGLVGKINDFVRQLFEHSAKSSWFWFLTKKSFADPQRNFFRLADISLMSKFVDCFDRSIKGLTGSKNYSREDKVARFKVMLEDYKKLFVTWFAFIPAGGIALPQYWLDYIELIESLWKRINQKRVSQELLEATPGFNVAAFAIGNGTNLEERRVQRPSSLEDFFTTIHQCLLNVLSSLSACSGAGDVVRPAMVTELEKIIAQQPGSALVGLAASNGGMSITYNKPLSNHSGQYVITYDQKTKATLLTIKLVGGNWARRWTTIARDSQVVLDLLGASCTEVKTTESGCSITVTVGKLLDDGHRADYAPKLTSLLRAISDYSNGVVRGSFGSELLDSRLVSKLFKGKAQQKVVDSLLNKYIGGGKGGLQDGYRRMLERLEWSYADHKEVIQQALDIGAKSDSEDKLAAILCLLKKILLREKKEANIPTAQALAVLKKYIDLPPAIICGDFFSLLACMLDQIPSDDLVKIFAFFVQKKGISKRAYELKRVYELMEKLLDRTDIATKNALSLVEDFITNNPQSSAWSDVMDDAVSLLVKLLERKDIDLNKVITLFLQYLEIGVSSPTGNRFMTKLLQQEKFTFDAVVDVIRKIANNEKIARSWVENCLYWLLKQESFTIDLNRTLSFIQELSPTINKIEWAFFGLLKRKEFTTVQAVEFLENKILTSHRPLAGYESLDDLFSSRPDLSHEKALELIKKLMQMPYFNSDVTAQDIYKLLDCKQGLRSAKTLRELQLPVPFKDRVREVITNYYAAATSFFRNMLSLPAGVRALFSLGLTA